MTSDVRFREVQRLRRRRWLATVVGATLCLLLLAVEAGSLLLGALALAAGGVVLAATLLLRLTVEVRADGLFVEYRPFHRSRLIPHVAIRDVTYRRYRPATGLGRWGVRLGVGKPVYNVAGDDSVLVRYRDADGEDREMVVGSTRASRLASELSAARNPRPWRSGRLPVAAGRRVSSGGAMSGRRSGQNEEARDGPDRGVSRRTSAESRPPA